MSGRGRVCRADRESSAPMGRASLARRRVEGRRRDRVDHPGSPTRADNGHRRARTNVLQRSGTTAVPRTTLSFRGGAAFPTFETVYRMLVTKAAIGRRVGADLGIGGGVALPRSRSPGLGSLDRDSSATKLERASDRRRRSEPRGWGRHRCKQATDGRGDGRRDGRRTEPCWRAATKTNSCAAQPRHSHLRGCTALRGGSASVHGSTMGMPPLEGGTTVVVDAVHVDSTFPPPRRAPRARPSPPRSSARSSPRSPDCVGHADQPKPRMNFASSTCPASNGGRT